jgi:hypothetical protein
MQGDEERAGCQELSINNRQLRRMGNTSQGRAIEDNTADDTFMVVRGLEIIDTRDSFQYSPSHDSGGKMITPP